MKLLYFAWLRAASAPPRRNWRCHKVRDVAGLLAWLQAGAAAAMPRHCAISIGVRVAVNQDYVGPEHEMRDGDEVAIFPPVTGG